jgi:hypothetical protein
MRAFDSHFMRDRHLRALEREANRLWQARADAPIIPLEHPYQRGWQKSFVLEKDVLRRPDVDIFRAVLNAINQRVFSRDSSFVRPNGQPIVLRPRIIRIREWLKLAWPASQQRFFSYGCWRLDDHDWLRKSERARVTGFRLFRTWWLREDIQPFMITHQRVELPHVRERLAEIESYMEKVNGRRRLDWLHGHRHNWRGFETTRAEHVAEENFAEQLYDTHLPD